MITSAEFARRIGVSREAVSKAIKVGRVPIYDVSGARVTWSKGLRFFVRPEEAAQAFRLSRARIDDDKVAEIARELDAETDLFDAPPPPAVARPPRQAKAPAPAPAKPTAQAPPPAAPPSPIAADDEAAPVSGTLVRARTESEVIRADLLRIRAARERGDLIDRRAVLEGLAVAGQTIVRRLRSVRSRAEDLHAAALTGGVPAVMALLASIADEVQTDAANALVKVLEARDDDEPPPSQ